MKTKKARPVRTIKLLRQPSPYEPGLLGISDAKKTHFYVLQEIPCEIGGRGFVMHRLGLGSIYHLRIGRPEDCSCDCMGFCRHDHCKHVDGLRALMQADRL